MDFELSDDQRLLSDSLARLFAEQYGFDRRREVSATALGWSRAMWERFAELGLTGLGIPEAFGGYGGGPVETMLVMEAMGRALTLEPYLGTAVLGATAIRAAGSADQARVLLPKIAEGGLLLAWAHGEEAARHDQAYVATTARRDGGGFRLDGVKAMVPHGGDADLLLVTGRVCGDPGAEEGLGLFLVDASAPGLLRQGFRSIDGTAAADLVLSDVQAEALGVPGQAWPAIRAVIEAGIAAVCAEAVGAMEAAHALTVDYLKTRSQFGRSIGSNQALQHRAAEMLVQLEQARSMAILAAVAMTDPEPRTRALDLSRAKLIVGRAARFVGQHAVQLHGGIGLTEEYAAGHYLRRLTVIEQMFGDSNHHLALLADAA